MAPAFCISCYNSGSLIMNIIKLCFNMDGNVVSIQVTILKSPREQTNAVKFFSSFRLSLNLTDLIKYGLDHADPAILFVCSVQEHVFAMVKPSKLLTSSFVEDNVIHF